ncbi:MAG: glycoside hydrolase family 99-like domain-containing protein [Pseudoclavibacter sp.]|nr:glycoside hydrolase family 99-like domain-containing protein [Pseudoclavibacter sp.]
MRIKPILGRVKARLLGGSPPAAPAEPGPPAGPGLAAFLQRNEGASFTGFPAVWRLDYPPLADPAPIAVVMHVYYTELVEEVLEQLRAIEVPFDLIVTNASGRELDLNGAERTAARSVRVLPVENHGRDIWPTVQLVNAGLLDPYDIVFKIHTKRSEWRAEHAGLAGSGEEWKQGFYRQLLGSPENVRDILQAMRENPQIGAVTSTGSLTGAEHWGGNLHTAKELLQRLRLRPDLQGIEFPAGSIYWIRGFILQGLRSLMLDEADFEPEAGQIDGTTAHAVERLIGLFVQESGMHSYERPDVAAEEPASAAELTAALRDPQPRARAIAYYLPQFHPFPQNDAWWGAGFTEWHNVAKARPLYYGHNQPLLPSELGFYDLRLDAVREQQAGMAKRAGISGFMYYYYWFSGTRLMDMPIRRLADGDLDQPFCIMWANENWTRRWDGEEKNVLIAQEYERVPPQQFIEDVLPLLKDPRYMRVGGAALLAVYRIAQMPDYHEVLEHWRTRAREEGVGELFITSVDVGTNMQGLRSDYEAAGVQGFIAFPPHNHEWGLAYTSDLGVSDRMRGMLLDYRTMAMGSEQSYLEDYPAHRFPGAMVNFDNTARRQWEPDAWVGSNPYTFRRWLAACASAVADRPADERIVIINAWNEWAESAVLEPTVRWGRCYLQAARSALV